MRMCLRLALMVSLFSWTACAAKGPSAPAAKPRQRRPAPAVVATPPPVAEAPDEAAAAPPESSTAAEAEASPPPAAPVPPPAADGSPIGRSKADPFGDVGFREVNQKDWLAGIRSKITQQEKNPPGELCLSPGLLRAAFVRSPTAAIVKPGRRPPLRRHEIVVVDNQGRPVASFRALAAPGNDEPPTGLRFLSDERLVYEVSLPAPASPSTAIVKRPATKSPPRKPNRAGAGRGKPPREPVHAAIGVEASSPPRLFVIQPIAPRSRPIRCQGFHFTFTGAHDRLAFVGGPGGSAFVAVDGAQVYPRRGRTLVASPPVWSKDGHSLAFLELPTSRPARLVLVAEVDNPTGDTTWDLPADVKVDGASVFWANNGKVVVGKTVLRPIFSASFARERP